MFRREQLTNSFSLAFTNITIFIRVIDSLKLDILSVNLFLIARLGHRRGTDVKCVRFVVFAMVNERSSGRFIYRADREQSSPSEQSTTS